MKRFALLTLLFVAIAAAAIAGSPHAQAGIFGGSKATPSPSPSPSALPTASPEPPEVAIPRLQAKLKANPNDQQAMTDLAAQFLQINRADLAVQLTQHLLQMGDKSAQVYYIDGYAMAQAGRDDAAVSDLENARNVDPTNVAVLSQLVTEYLKLNRFTDAERIAQHGITLNPNQASSYSTMGSVYAAEAKFDDARTQFEKAAKMDPTDSGPIFQIATTYAQQDNIPAALQTIDRALAIDPKDVQALVYKADLYAKQHDDAHAATAYDDAVVAATNDAQKAQIMLRKAAYYTEEKKLPLAEGVFEQTIAQYPKVTAPYVAFGDFYMNQKNVAAATTEYLAALKIEPDNADALGRLGQVSLGTGKWNDAIGYLKHLVSVSPDPQGLLMLGQAYSFVHDYASSKDACSKSFQMQRDPSTLGCIASADFELKNYKEASQIFDIIDANVRGYLDRSPQLLYVAAKSYEFDNQKQKAIGAYKRLLPILQKGSKGYNEVASELSALSKPSKRSKPPGHRR